MEILLAVVVVVSLIPSVLFFYAVLSMIVQLIFKNNFNEEEHKTKWRLSTPASYTLIILCNLSLVNMFILNEKSIDMYLSYGILISAYWYLGSLTKYHFKSLIEKLN